MGQAGQPTGHVFISYVREDSGEVDGLQGALEAAGVRVWRDTVDLWPGQDWRAIIRNAIISDALVFIACFSRQSVARETSYQNEELNLAIEQLRLRRPGVPWLIPIRFDDCAIPDYDISPGRTLRSIQHADLFGDRRGEAESRLIAAVLRILGQHASGSAAQASTNSETASAVDQAETAQGSAVPGTGSGRAIAAVPTKKAMRPGFEARRAPSVTSVAASARSNDYERTIREIQKGLARLEDHCRSPGYLKRTMTRTRAEARDLATAIRRYQKTASTPADRVTKTMVQNLEDRLEAFYEYTQLRGEHADEEHMMALASMARFARIAVQDLIDYFNTV